MLEIQISCVIWLYQYELLHGSKSHVLYGYINMSSYMVPNLMCYMAISI